MTQAYPMMLLFRVLRVGSALCSVFWVLEACVPKTRSECSTMWFHHKILYTCLSTEWIRTLVSRAYGSTVERTLAKPDNSLIDLS